MKTVVWDPGMISYNKLSPLIDMLVNAGNCVYMMTEERRKNDWQSVIPRCRLKIYQEFEVVSSSPRLQDEINSVDIYKNIIDDHRTLLIAERVSTHNLWASTFNSTRNIEIMIFNAWTFLNDSKPDFILFQATPHALNSWILGKVAEYLSVPVYMIQTSPLPWRFWLIKGIDEQLPVFPGDMGAVNIDDKLLNGFFKKNSASYSDAIPSYEKRRLDARGGKFWSWNKELKDCIKHPSQIPSLFKKRKLYDVYNSLVTRFSEANIKNVVLFLHYQPERTSLPEGRWFSQQWLIIRALSASLPTGWRLLVKEHPSIFTGRFNWRYRHPQLYRDIVSLHNVDLISVEEDTFALIDKAEAIATISGAVGIQSLIRGTPVLVFGYGSYRNAYGAFEIQSQDNIREALQNISVMTKNQVALEMKEYLKGINKMTISALSATDNGVDIYSLDARVLGHVQLLKSFFETHI